MINRRFPLSLLMATFTASASASDLPITHDLVALRATFPQNFHDLVQLSEGLTHFQDVGNPDAATVVLIHGVSGPMIIWDETAKVLQDAGFRTIRYDLYGRGFSSRLDDSSYDLPTYLRQLEDLLQSRDVRSQVHVVGSSFGSIVATEFALQHPDLVKSVTLMGPAGFPIQTPALAKLRDVPVLGDILFRLSGKKMILEQNRKYFVSGNPPEMLWNYFASQLEVPGTAEAMLATMRNSPVQDYLDSYAVLGQTSLPTQVIWGVDDATFPYSNHSTLAALVPQAQILALPRTAHLPMVESPAQTHESLLNHLRHNEAVKTTMQTSPSTRKTWHMPITRDIDGEAPASDIASFDDPFFNQFETKKVETTFDNGVSRQYAFPTFYRDVVTLQSFTTCNYDEALRLVTPYDAKPIVLTPGRAAIVVSSYSYTRVRGLPAYNEVAIAIPVIRAEKMGVPLLPLLMTERFGTAAVVISMPVTSKENEARGHRFWGLPKKVFDIRFDQVADNLSVSVFDEQGLMMLSHTANLRQNNGRGSFETTQTTLWSSLEGQTIFANAYNQATWHTSNKWSALLRRTVSPTRLNIGPSPHASFLTALDVSGTPFKTRVSFDLKSAFTLPSQRI